MSRHLPPIHYNIIERGEWISCGGLIYFASLIEELDGN